MEQHIKSKIQSPEKQKSIQSVQSGETDITHIEEFEVSKDKEFNRAITPNLDHFELPTLPPIQNIVLEIHEDEVISDDDDNHNHNDKYEEVP